MNQLFEYFLNNYLDGEQFDNKEKGYHKVLIEKLPEYIRTLVNDKYKVKGSCGASNKAEVPWIGVFNTSITSTAQYGIYIVYLFRADMKGFYLCLGQGITNFNKFGKDRDKIMYKLSDYFKDKIDSVFSKDRINLFSRTLNGKGYEKVNILNKYYVKEKIVEYDFEKDLKDMINIYEEISLEMKYQTYDDIIDNLISNTNPNYIMEKEAVEIIEQEIIKEAKDDEIEIISLKRVDIPQGKKRTKYTEIAKKAVKKIDYLKKQRRNASNGLLGERLVMAYEEDKLRNSGREDLIDKIKWISKEDDGTGYDILSFDEKGNEIYIEVKSTEGKEDSVFFISANEIDVMEQFKNKYYIYRVFNIKTKNPEVYVLNYCEFINKIDLVIEGYSATLKGEL